MFNKKEEKMRISRLNLRYVVAGAACLAVSFFMFWSCGGGSSSKIKMTTEAGGEVSFYLAGSGVATVDWGDGSEKVLLTLNKRSVRFEHKYPSATIRTIIINGDNITGLTCVKKMTSLDVSRCTELTSLDYQGNQLASLDLSKNTALIKLTCGGRSYGDCTKLSSLDLSKNVAMTHLEVFSHELRDLDVSKNIALTHLKVGTVIIYLDVSKNIALRHLELPASLVSLDVSQNTKLEYLYVDSPNLSTEALNALFGTLHSNTISGREKIIQIGKTKGAGNRSIAREKGWVVKDRWG